MSDRRWRPRGGRGPQALTSGLVFLIALGAAAPGRAASVTDGGALYRQRCAACHGERGRGDGPDAALCASRPRDLHDGVLDQLPEDEVVRRVLDGRLTFDPPAMRARAADVESLVAYLRRLPDVDWHAADAGAALYAERCEVCHGIYGRPSGAPPPGVRTLRDLSDPALQRTVSDADLVAAVRHGRAGMPALTPRLTASQATQVAAFVRLLSPGHTTYTQYCATCHGDHGVGSGSFAEAYRAPTAIFDRAYFARHDDEDLQRNVWHMLEDHQPAMPHFRGTLSSAQVRAILRYVKSERDR